MVICLYDYNIDDFGGVEFFIVEVFMIKGEVKMVVFKFVCLLMVLNLCSIVRRVSLFGMVKCLGLVF